MVVRYAKHYTSSLNVHHWVEIARWFTHPYQEAGLLGIRNTTSKFAHTNISKTSWWTDSCPRRVQRSSHSRTKPLKSNLLIQGEQLSHRWSLGRQGLTGYPRILNTDMVKRIDMVTTKDIVCVAKRVLFGLDIDLRTPLSACGLCPVEEIARVVPTVVIWTGLKHGHQRPFSNNGDMKEV
jgi:hypothetical protein